MDEQTGVATVHGPAETQYGSWPKKRTLLIGAQGFEDFLTAERLLKRVEEDFKKYNKPPGRHNFIAYSKSHEVPGGHGAREYTGQVAVWYTATQVTFYFSHEDTNG